MCIRDSINAEYGEHQCPNMSTKPIREVDAKTMMAKHLLAIPAEDTKLVAITPETDLDQLTVTSPWLLTTPLVAKPDQLIKRRGKAGLLKLNASWEEVKAWVSERRGTRIEVDGVSDTLSHFIVEPFVAHDQTQELYICIASKRTGDVILFYEEGGVDVGDVDAKARQLLVPVVIKDEAALLAQVRSELVDSPKIPKESMAAISGFVVKLLKFYRQLHFAYLEINPLMYTDSELIPLDVAAKLDQTAEYECKVLWGAISFPPPWGHTALPEEQKIRDLDAKTGSSLKLTILNKAGRVWTMVAGGGASVVYADTICDVGFSNELANYGEYSGAPSEELTNQYACTILGLMTAGEPRDDGKVLIIGGGIANFTNVASTFSGIISALTTYREELIRHQVSVFVRRGGPNYQEGLALISEAGKSLGLPMHVYGPETHVTAVVPMALGLEPIVDSNLESSAFMKAPSVTPVGAAPENYTPAAPFEGSLFTAETRCVVFGMQNRAVQGMLDFDFICKRSKPSVAAMIYPFGSDHSVKFYWGENEVLMPVYKEISKGLARHPEVSVVVSFASCRSVLPSSMEMLEYPQVKVLAIIAEGVPEIYTKQITKKAQDNDVLIIGPATVGGIKPGCFRIGNTGGMLDNIVSSKLYRPGSVAYVSRSGGMSNELNNVISRNSDGVYEGVAVGGDMYPGSTFLGHLLRYQEDPGAKILVLLGEVGGTDEYDIIEAMKDGRITKPLVAWCIGTCSKMFAYEVQFGHAGACAHGVSDRADVKNAALAEAGAHVPTSFNDFGATIKQVYTKLVESGGIVPAPEPPVPKIPVDYKWARELGLVRKSASFISTISDDRGEELIYAGVPISRVLDDDMGVAGVVSLLWFKRRLPHKYTKFIEMVLMITADHGPAVSGAHNTIVTARAGKDLISSLCSGLLTIGPRFGGAVDGAASTFAQAHDADKSPESFVSEMRKANKLIQGIGHRVKSATNPDMRVSILKDYVLSNFESTPVLNFAMEVEQVTLQKKENLILNVDGTIGAAFVDLLRGSGAFTREEADDYIEMGCLNALFVLGRTIGFIGHFLDQVRLKEGLYRHPWDDIAYLMDEARQNSN
eukprot:TRINITY_DN13910_c0_g1_i2.p1 TRINITY_DN13910_c0_g1~~TRINITY_DN13910_c0_g1_i2.p1  ORF type:complete len:1094 (-),score=318.64 TRINITY_DN13910_c0_g1_i2:280-3561(-)